MLYRLLVFTLLFIAKGYSGQLWEDWKKNTLVGLKHIPGWCRPEKATEMMNLVHKEHPKLCVEIGVFGGSSIYPTAQALKFLKEGGVVYAIDSWKNNDCLVGATPGADDYTWWKDINLEQIYRDFLNMLDWYELNEYCKVLRMTGEEALSHFADNSIDILHIDGNHFEGLRDAKMYLPKVKPGGYIWFDDANWPETQDAISYLSSHCIPGELVVIGGSSYQLFRKKEGK